MQFAPHKTELMYFTRARNEIKLRVSIGEVAIELQPVYCFLGI